MLRPYKSPMKLELCACHDGKTSFQIFALMRGIILREMDPACDAVFGLVVDLKRESGLTYPEQSQISL